MAEQKAFTTSKVADPTVLAMPSRALSQTRLSRTASRKSWPDHVRPDTVSSRGFPEPERCTLPSMRPWEQRSSTW